MNILYFTRTMGLGGTEKVIIQLCSEMKDKVNKIIVCSSGGVNVSELDKLGVKHYEIADIEVKNIKVIFNTLKNLLKIIKEEDINVVHTHHRMAAFYTKILHMFIKKFDFIHTSHNTFKDKKIFTNFALSKCRIVAVGDVVKNNLIKDYRIKSKNIEVIHNSIQINEFDLKEINELENYKKEGYFIVGNIGRLCEQKGMTYYIEAMSKVVKNNPKIMGVIVGEGEDREKIEALIRKLSLQNNIKLLGYRNDILNIISNLDLVVLSSLWEGYPLLPIEVFSMGRTIIATNVDGTPEIVRHDENGILVEPKNSSAIADAILKLYHDENKRKSLESKSKHTYDNDLKFEVFVKKYEDLYMKFK